MVSRLASLATIVLALLPSSGAAQEPLTLDQAIAAALAKNAGFARYRFSSFRRSTRR
jgi:hypothetical protein